MPGGDPAGDHPRPRDRGEINRALQYAGEASGLKYAVAVRGPDESAMPAVGHDPRLDADPAVGPVIAAAPLATPAPDDTRRWASSVHAAMEDPARSVLVAVDPAARAVRIVTGPRSGRRLPDDRLAGIAESMAYLFATRGLVPGLVAGLQQLGQLAGPPPPRRSRPGRDSATVTVAAAPSSDAG